VCRDPGWFGRETLAGGFVINFGNNNLSESNFSPVLVMRSAVSRIALWKTRRIAKAGWVKERMCCRYESMSPILMPAPAVALPPLAVQASDALMIL
jgi:hypothetical protein